MGTWEDCHTGVTEAEQVERDRRKENTQSWSLGHHCSLATVNDGSQPFLPVFEQMKPSVQLHLTSTITSGLGIGYLHDDMLLSLLPTSVEN